MRILDFGLWIADYRKFMEYWSGGMMRAVKYKMLDTRLIDCDTPWCGFKNYITALLAD